MKSIIMKSVLALVSILVSASATFADRLYIDSFEIKGGETKDVSICLENTQQVTAFQANLSISPGLELVRQGDELMTVAARAGADHSLIVNANEGSYIRIACFSNTNSPFSGNDGAVVDMKIKAADGFDGGWISLDNIKLSDSSNKDIDVENTWCNVTAIIGVQSISLSNETLDLKVGQSWPLVAYVEPANATDQTVVWTSDNESVATVDANGNVTAIALGSATISATCGNVSAYCTVTVSPTEVEGVTVSQATAQLKAGESITLTAIVVPEDATDKTVVWTSDNESVATVDGNGNITAVSLGMATITASSGNYSASCVVTVIATPVEGVTVSQATAQLKAGESITLTATVVPEDATDKTVVWTSDNEAVATVDANGNVTAVSLGTATITASCGNYSASCVVSVIATPVESVTLSQTTAELKVGGSVSLSAEVLPIEATDRTVVWTSDNEAVATVDGNGNVIAISLGTATITANCGSVSASCVVSVIATPVESVTLSQTTAELKVGESVSLTAEVLPIEATDRTVIWTSDNEAVATVDGNGNVTAVSLGTATITANCGSVSASCVVTVYPVLVESITLSTTNWNGEEGENFHIDATVLPEDATDKSLVWSSSDESIATVDSEGNVSVLKEGSCVITATAADGSGVSAECMITSTTGVDGILTETDNLDIYDFNGLLIKKDCGRESLKGLTPGIYIIRQGGAIKKLVIR